MSSKEVAVRPSITSLATQDWSADKLDLLKRTICKDANDDEFALFIGVAKRSGLDPFTRQIHSVKRWNDKAGRYDMAVQTGIDGYRLIAQRTGAYAGSDDPMLDDEIRPSRATVTVYKIVQGTRCPFTATARWDEYYPGDKQGFMWRKMPCVMLSKCAEALALRKAFPAELSDVYTDTELEQSANRGGVYPAQPEPGDGIQTDEYCCSGNLAKAFPALAKKPISKCDPAILRQAVEGIESKAKKGNKPIPPWAAEFIKHAEPVVASWENAQPQNPDALDLGQEDGPMFNEPGSEG